MALPTLPKAPTLKTNTNQQIQLKDMESLTKIYEIVQEWQAEFPEPKYYHYLLLDDRLGSRLGTIKFGGAVYYSYQEFHMVMKFLDDDFHWTPVQYKFDPNIDGINTSVDYVFKGQQNKTKIWLSPMGGSDQSSISYMYPTTNKSGQESKLDWRDINDTEGRCLVKQVSFNLGLGMRCWTQPDAVKNSIGQEDAPIEKQRASRTKKAAPQVQPVAPQPVAPTLEQYLEPVTLPQGVMMGHSDLPAQEMFNRITPPQPPVVQAPVETVDQTIQRPQPVFAPPKFESQTGQTVNAVVMNKPPLPKFTPQPPVQAVLPTQPVTPVTPVAPVSAPTTPQIPTQQAPVGNAGPKVIIGEHITTSFTGAITQQPSFRQFAGQYAVTNFGLNSLGALSDQQKLEILTTFNEGK